MMIWTNEKVETLKKYVEQGMSKSKIAIQMGVTKNSIIGKCWRLGIETDIFQKPSCKIDIETKKISIFRHNQPKKQKINKQDTFIFEEMTSKKVEFKEPPKDGLTIFELNHKTCRWPLWGKEDPMEVRRYCGCEVDVNGIYCHMHKQKAFVSTERQRQALALAS